MANLLMGRSPIAPLLQKIINECGNVEIEVIGLHVTVKVHIWTLYLTPMSTWYDVQDQIKKSCGHCHAGIAKMGCKNCPGKICLDCHYAKHTGDTKCYFCPEVENRYTLKELATLRRLMI